MKHVHCHDAEVNLSKQILDQQLVHDWPGQSKVAKMICEELDISGLFDQNVNKKQFKSLVRRACKRKSEEELLTQIQSYKKMAAIKNEIQKGNSYFFTETLKNARTLFKFRVDLFESKMNYKNKPEYKAEKYLCDSCEREIDLSTHVLYCSSYAPLREDKSLNNDSDLAEYLQKVLEIRVKLRLNR